MHDIAREAAERLLTDTARVIAPDGGVTYDEATLTVTLPGGAVVWEGPASFAPALSSRATLVPGGETHVNETVVRLPVSAPAVEPGSHVVCLSSDDDGLVGTQFEVVRTVLRSSSITRRYEARRMSPRASTTGSV